MSNSLINVSMNFAVSHTKLIMPSYPPALVREYMFTASKETCRAAKLVHSEKVNLEIYHSTAENILTGV